MARLLKGMIEVEQVGDTITLPDGVHWPDMGSGVLYVREEYAKMWEGVFKKGLADELRGAAIIGTPGSE